jgi:uncharacterized protein YodC (DUF2158 family)
MAAQFKVGERVRLKSGGPEMTVKEVDMWMRKDEVMVVWFAGAKLETACFPVDTLVKVSEQEKK